MAVEPKEKKVKVSVVKKEPEPKVDLDAGMIQDEEQEDSVKEAATLGRKRHPGPWALLHKNKKENLKLILRHSHAGNLIGHDHKTGEVILVDPDFEAPKTAQEISEDEMAAKGPHAGIAG